MYRRPVLFLHVIIIFLYFARTGSHEQSRKYNRPSRYPEYCCLHLPRDSDDESTNLSVWPKIVARIHCTILSRAKVFFSPFSPSI